MPTADNALVARLKMGLTSAPNLYQYHPTTGARAMNKSEADKLDFGRSGFRAEGVAAWVEDKANLRLSFARPIDRTKAFITGFTIAASVPLVWYQWALVKQLLFHRRVWALTSMVSGSDEAAQASH